MIKFYTTTGEYGCFSNFSRHSVKLDGKSWPTSEHYFQAQKFLDEGLKSKVRNAKTPSMAASIGRDRSLPLRKDWESIKLDVMRKVIRAKFTQHEDLKLTLLNTGNEELIEHTVNDKFWADGGDGKGLNWLGKILMEIREEIRQNGN